VLGFIHSVSNRIPSIQDKPALANENPQELLQTGIDAARRGNRMVARRILQQVLEQDPNNELAWIWLASVAETTGQRRDYLERVLAINPNNERAKQALERLSRSAPAPEQSTLRDRRQRVNDLERDALLRARQRQRQSSVGLSRTRFGLIAAIALVMIGLGLYLLWQETQTGNDEEATPTSSAADAAVVVPTRAPIPTQVGTLSPPKTPAPTWTASPMPTATNIPTATATPPALNTYSLIVSRQRASDTWELVSLRADGTGVQPITIALSPDDAAAGLSVGSVSEAAYSPDGTQIVFVGQISSSDGDFAALFVAPASGGASQRITNQRPTTIESPSWSPQGDFVAFASDADGDFDIYIVAATGGSATPLTINTAEDRQPAWSPTDDVIMFASDIDGPGELEIYRMDREGSELKRLTYSINTNDSPAWNADGTQVVFTSTRNGDRDLYTMNADGTNDRAVIVRDAEGAADFNPAWSPDGRWIAFASNRENNEGLDLFIIQPDGSELQLIMAGTIDFPSWNPQ
jgi:hypothetical protein